MEAQEMALPLTGVTRAERGDHACRTDFGATNRGESMSAPSYNSRQNLPVRDSYISSPAENKDPHSTYFCGMGAEKFVDDQSCNETAWNIPRVIPDTPLEQDQPPKYTELSSYKIVSPSTGRRSRREGLGAWNPFAAESTANQQVPSTLYHAYGMKKAPAHVGQETAEPQPEQKRTPGPVHDLDSDKQDQTLLLCNNETATLLAQKSPSQHNPSTFTCDDQGQRTVMDPKQVDVPPHKHSALCKRSRETNPSETMEDDCRSDESWECLSEDELAFMGLVFHESPDEDAVLEGSSSQFVQDFANQFSQSLNLAKYIVRCGKHNSDVSSEKGPTNSEPQATTNSETHPSCKRTWRQTDSQDERNDDEENDEEPLRPPQRRKCSEGQDHEKLLACPFSKYDPSRYSDRNMNEKDYRKCSTCILRDITTLKQHLWRKHKKPDHFCGRCGEVFESQELCISHSRRQICSMHEERYTEKITESQRKQIEKRTTKGKKSAREDWNYIYQVLFPSAPIPSSPYLGEDDSEALMFAVDLFRYFGAHIIFDLIQNRQGQGSAANLQMPSRRILDEAFEIVAPDLLQRLRGGPNETKESSESESIRQSNHPETQETGQNSTKPLDHLNTLPEQDDFGWAVDYDSLDNTYLSEFGA